MNDAPFSANEDDKRVLGLLYDDMGQTSHELFRRSDLTLGEIQAALVRLWDAKLIDRVVGAGAKNVYWSRKTPAPPAV